MKILVKPLSNNRDFLADNDLFSMFCVVFFCFLLSFLLLLFLRECDCLCLILLVRCDRFDVLIIVKRSAQ